MSRFELAQLNIARLKAPVDSPALKDFVDSLDRINRLAEQSPGYVWRLKDDAGNATALRHFGPDYIVNLTVWKDVAALHDYVYKSGHVEIMRRRREWFERMAEAYSVLWWVPAGERPTPAAAEERLELLRAAGPTSHAFTFQQAFAAPDAESGIQTGSFKDLCSAS